MLGSLHVAQTGLTAAKTSVEGVMNNISNENTPGYKKRIVELTESAHIDGSVTGRGVIVSDVKRLTNEYIYDNLLKEVGTASFYDELSARLSDIESLFYETEDSGFSSDLNRYFQSVENLRANPTDEINKSNVINDANIIVDNIKNLYDGIDEYQTIGMNAVKDDIEIINGILSDIGKINEKIGQQLVPPNDLLDKRDALEKDLAKYVDVSVDRSTDYELKIGGSVAVRYNTNIHNVSLKEEYTPQRDKYYDGSINSIKNVVDTPGFDADDQITYNLNNLYTATVTYGESITTDWDNDSLTADTTQTVDSTNYMRALAYKINNTTAMSSIVTAYNGDTITDATTGIESETSPLTENYLNIKSDIDGRVGKFDGYISISKNTGATADDMVIINKDDVYSKDATDNIQVHIFDEEIDLKRGSIKAMTDNINSESGLNVFNEYQDKLDDFVRTFVDIHDSFVTLPDDTTYLYGKMNTESSTTGTVTDIGMFSGSTVSTFRFNEDAIVSLDDKKLKYLATFQWKTDFDFDGTAQDGTTNSATSFSSYYQNVQVQIASDKENNDYLKDTQSAIVNSLQGSYDKLVNVDKDEEMINLIKFQASYEANAKIVTVVDEMLATLLGMKR